MHIKQEQVTANYKHDVSTVEKLVYANRILFDHGVVDGFGHVSARDDRNQDQFLLARSMAPALVTSGDIFNFDMNGNAIDANGHGVYLERFIHAAVYRARPEVKAVVHSHSPALIPYGVTGMALRPIFHMSGFLGAGAPIFEMRDKAGMTDLLISNNVMGDNLAAVLADNPVVIMRGHGSVVVGCSLEQVVFRAIYTEINARLQAEATKFGPINFLTMEEAILASATNDAVISRPWELWKARVEKQTNEIR